MFVLRKNPAILDSAEKAAEQIREARQRLADASCGLVFEPGEHRYFLGGKELRSVSSIVSHFAPVDTLALARRAAVNPKHQYFGRTPEEIMELWALKRDNAAAAGTRVHAFAEACCDFLLGKEEEMEPRFREMLTEDGLVATEPKDVAVARWWADIDWNRYAFVAKETRIANPVLRYAGTFDTLLYDRYLLGYAQKDYKSNEDLDKWYGDKLLPPLNNIKANDIGKYTVQQTLYTITLRQLGLNVVSNDLVWLKENEYEERGLDMRYDKIVAYAVNQLNNQS